MYDLAKQLTKTPILGFIQRKYTDSLANTIEDYLVNTRRFLISEMDICVISSTCLSASVDLVQFKVIPKEDKRNYKNYRDFYILIEDEVPF
jgi:hypothetical protein